MPWAGARSCPTPELDSATPRSSPRSRTSAASWAGGCPRREPCVRGHADRPRRHRDSCDPTRHRLQLPPHPRAALTPSPACACTPACRLVEAKQWAARLLPTPAPSASTSVTRRSYPGG
jgi:hypothetical protein